MDYLLSPIINLHRFSMGLVKFWIHKISLQNIVPSIADIVLYNPKFQQRINKFLAKKVDQDIIENFDIRILKIFIRLKNLSLNLLVNLIKKKNYL